METNVPDENFSLIALREMYPGYSDDTLKQIGEAWDRYLTAMLQIFERMQNDPAALAELRLLTSIKPVRYDGTASTGRASSVRPVQPQP